MTEYICEHARHYRFDIWEKKIEAQFRCFGLESLLNWIDSTLQIRSTNNILFDEDNLVCTSMKRNLAKSTSSLKEIGWTIFPPGKLEDWDGLLSWFMKYIPRHQELLENNDIRRWYEICYSMEIIDTLPRLGKDE